MCASPRSPCCCACCSRRPPPRTTSARTTATGAASSRSPTSAAPCETVDRAAGTEGEGLPLTWCGTERTTDNLVNAVFPPTTQQFKVVYAYAADRANRFAAWKDALQADVSLIGRFMGAQSGGRRTPRFDMGTDCGPQYVDVQVVALPGPRASYANDLAALKAAVRLQAPATVGQRNVVVLADRMSSSPAGYWSGIGESYVDESTERPAQPGRPVRRAVGAGPRARPRRRPRRLVGGGDAARDDAQPRRRRRLRPALPAATATAAPCSRR